jgi:transposase-like protein
MCEHREQGLLYEKERTDHKITAPAPLLGLFSTDPIFLEDLKRKAHSAVHRAVESGVLVMPRNCEACSTMKKLHAHHEDYTRPLDVRWLCPRCHKRLHVQWKKAAKRHGTVVEILNRPRIMKTLKHVTSQDIISQGL